MIKRLRAAVTEPQYIVTTDVAFAQVDAWYGHTIRDLKMDIVYPEDHSGKAYPCIVWICGGAWLKMDKSAHLAYLAQLAREGFVVASVEYRTSNEGSFPMQLQDVKSAIRYLKAHAKRFRIDSSRFGVSGESAGGYLSAMAALTTDRIFDVGAYTEFDSSVQAACPWYPPTDVEGFYYASALDAAASPESLLLGKNVMLHLEEAKRICPLYYVTPQAPPFLIIHGLEDHTVPFAQGQALYDALNQVGCDVTLVALEGADHADIQFFQAAVWEEMADFFCDKLGVRKSAQ